MGNLYMIIHSPYERKEVETLLSLAQKGDGIIFIKNGVFINKYEGCPGNYELDGVKLYALQEDLEARGISNWRYEVVDYDGFADLIMEYSKVIS